MPSKKTVVALAVAATTLAFVGPIHAIEEVSAIKEIAAVEKPVATANNAHVSGRANLDSIGALGTWMSHLRTGK